MKLKYKVADGEIIALGHMPGLQAGAGEAVEDFDGDFPTGRLEFYKRTAPGVISEKSQAEKDAVIEKIESPTEVEFTAFFDSLTDARKIEVLKKVIVKLAYRFITKKDFKNL